MQKILELESYQARLASRTTNYHYPTVYSAIEDGWKLLGPPLLLNNMLYWWLEREEEK